LIVKRVWKPFNSGMPFDKAKTLDPGLRRDDGSYLGDRKIGGLGLRRDDGSYLGDRKIAGSRPAPG
jgi:hypothetical protein